MKGLLLNNFYSMNGTINLLLGFCCFMGWFAYMARDVVALYGAIIYQSYVFVISCVIILGSDEKSKWNRVEVILPVKRIDIIRSKYLMAIIFTLISCVISLLTIAAFSYRGVETNYTELFVCLISALCVSLTMASIIMLEILLYGAGKAVVIAAISYWFLNVIYSFTWTLLQHPLGWGPEYNYNDMFIPTIILTIIIFTSTYSLAVCKHAEKEF